MGKLVYLLLVIILISPRKVFASVDTTWNLQEENFIEGSYSDFYVDNLNNIYLLTKNNQLKKINDKGDSAGVSNALRKFGDIYSLDVSNPLKILVYYKDFGTIVILDRFLSSINTIDLRKYGILQAQAVSQSYDNNYWVFDEVENKLNKIDDNGNILLQTPDFRTIFDESFSPEKIIDYNGFVYLYSKKSGCLIFDYYGAFKQKIEQSNLNYVQVIKDELYGFDSNHVYRFNIQNLTSTLYNFDLPLTGVIKLQRAMNTLYILMPEGLYTYSIHQTGH
jgi:hypothetical protein